jgi:hypothetical protein
LSLSAPLWDVFGAYQGCGGEPFSRAFCERNILAVGDAAQGGWAADKRGSARKVEVRPDFDSLIGTFNSLIDQSLSSFIVLSAFIRGSSPFPIHNPQFLQ